jgi:hypothetical protein
MLSVDLLLVGDALDGPVEEFVALQTQEQARRLFGGYRYEEITLTSGSTGYTLAHTPWGGVVEPLQYDSDGVLIPLQLFEFTVSGAVLSWTAPGLWWYQGTTPSQVVFRSLVEPGETSLLRGLYPVLDRGLTVHALRLGGAHAEVTSGAYSFYAARAGSRYNGTTVVRTSGGTVTVTPAPGTGRPRSYTPTSDSHLRDLLQADLNRGYQPLYYASGGSNSTLSLPVGTYTLSGGTDGSATVPALSGFLEAYDLGGVDVLCPVGLTYEALAASGVVAQLEAETYPTLLVAQTATSTVALSGSPVTSRQVCAVPFTVNPEAGTLRSGYIGAAPLVASLLAQGRFQLTLAPLGYPEFLPHYDQAGLHALAGTGYTAAYQSLSKGAALWHAVTGESEWPVSTLRAYQEVVRVTFLTLEPYIGTALLSLAQIETLLAAAYAAVTGGRVLSWTVGVQGEDLLLDLHFQPYGEVRSVSAQLSLGQVGTAR